MRVVSGWSLIVCTVPVAVCAATAHSTTLGFDRTELTLSPGQSAIVGVLIVGVPDPGLGGFELDVLFDGAVVGLADPNGGVRPFVPLGGDPDCELVRGAAPCPDPA